MGFILGILGLFFIENLWAKSVIMVSSLKGNAFASLMGRTWTLEGGEYLEDFTEILIEEGTQVTLSDYHQHKFHLSGSAHVKIINKVLELKRGYLWVQSSSDDHEDFAIHTANSTISYKNKAEAIISFDNASGKSQILVIGGFFSMRNLIRNEINQVIPAGHFSFIENHYNQGYPRTPTPVGQSSFKNVMNLFLEIHPLQEEERALVSGVHVKNTVTKGSRHLASVKPKSVAAHHRPAKHEGKIIFLKRKNHQSASIDVKGLLEEDLKRINRKNRRKDSHSTSHSHTRRSLAHKAPVRVKIFGLKQPSGVVAGLQTHANAAHKVNSHKHTIDPSSGHSPERGGNRSPASSGTLQRQDFEASLQEQQKIQTRHPEEMNQLIQDLESVKQDFETQY